MQLNSRSTRAAFENRESSIFLLNYIAVVLLKDFGTMNLSRASKIFKTSWKNSMKNLESYRYKS